MSIVTGSYGGLAHEQRNQESTVWIGGLDAQVNEELLFELMQQVGPVQSVSMPKDKVSQLHQGFGFCEFQQVEDAEYCQRIMNNIKLFGKPIKINRSTKDKGSEEWMANLFVGNLDPEVDDRLLLDTFSQFGCVLNAKVMCDTDSGKSRGFAFVTFDCFEASDAAIEGLDGQYLSNRQLSISYAFKKDGTTGERHGSPEERALAAKSGRKYEKPPVASFGSQKNVAQARASNNFSMMAVPPPLPYMNMPPMPMSMPPPMPMSMPPMPMGMNMGGFPGMGGMPPPMPYGMPNFPQAFQPPPMPHHSQFQFMQPPAAGSQQQYPMPPPPPPQPYGMPH